MRHSLFVLALLAGLPAFGAQPAARPAAPDLATAEVVDLTYPFDEKTLYWPNAPSNFQLTKLHEGKTPAGFFYAANSFCAPEHGGTHLDAPIHFAEGHPTADQVPVRQLIAPAVVIDVSRQAASDPDYRLTPAGGPGRGAAGPAVSRSTANRGSAPPRSPSRTRTSRP